MRPNGYRTLALAGLILGLVALCARFSHAAPSRSRTVEGTDQKGKRGAERLPEISVDLLGPISSLKGATWPREYDPVLKKADQPALMMTIDKPHELVIRLPGGRTLRPKSKLTFLTQNQDRGILEIVKLVPTMRLLPFQAAVSELERLLTEWDAQPTAVTKPRIADWRAYGNVRPDGVLSRRGGAVIHGETKGDIFFEIRPGEEGWFISFTIGPTVEVIEAMAKDAATQPSTRPATGPASTRASATRPDNDKRPRPGRK